MRWTRGLEGVCLVAMASCSVGAFAKPKVKTYPQSCNQVWAAVKIAAASPHYNFAQLDDAQKKGLVSTGNNLTGKRYLDITLTAPTPESCNVAVGGIFSGLVHDDKGDLFGRIEDALKASSQSATTPASPSPK